MKVRFCKYIFGAALAALTACNVKLPAPVPPVGDADGAIVLRAQVVDGGSGVQTKAEGGRHAKHTPFDADNKMTLQINGTWTGKGTITQETTGTTVAEVGDSKHNGVETDPLRFWNDYGVADPANTTGRAEGLTIYGAAVNDAGVSAPTVSNWTTLPWNLPTNQTGGWTANDLLTSNNISAGGDGTFKFDDFLGTSGDTPSNILEFTHAMSKITVVLTAGAGFPSSKFEKNVSVTLKQFKNTGNVNIVAKTSSASEGKNDIQMHLDAGGVNNATATFDALVYPGNQFDDATDILELNADGNTFVVTAAKLNAAIKKAIDANATTEYPLGTSDLLSEPKEYDTHLVQGWNYKLQVTVNKTGITVVATIVAWDEVTADPEYPKIRINDSFGQTGTAFAHDFDFFRSLTISGDYSKDAYVEHTETAGVHSYTFHDQLYWPDHSTHYFFRGVYPRVGASAGEIPAANFSASTSSAATIAVQNVAYSVNTYPSDLAVGYPRTTSNNCTAHGKDVATYGICATEGTIRMNFEYAMSKVEVRLKSSAVGAGHIDMTKGNTTVEIIGGYNKARIQLSDGLHDAYVDATDKGNYTLSKLETPVTDFLVTTRDAIVPQIIGDDVKFRITVTIDDKNDVYECRVNTISVKNSSPAVPVTEWAHGKHYIYELNVNKTAINSVATIKNWVTVNADEDVWF